MSQPWTRHERIGACDLYLGDARDIAPVLAYDAVVSDPPYGIAYQRGEGGKGASEARHYKPIVGDDRPFDPAPFLGKPAILFGADHFADKLPAGGMFHVWDKNPQGAVADDFSDAELFWSSWTRSRRVFRHLWKGMIKASERSDRRLHPTQKPVALMEDCLRLVPSAGVILDPFMGSGSTLVACAKLGRAGIGIEIDPGYFDIACRRVADAYRQPDLFVPAPPAPTQEALF